ncbi:MAG: hypothetical protein ACK5NL_23585, partial [Vibrio fluvialis]
PIMRSGAIVAEEESIEQSRDRGQRELEQLHPSIRRFLNPREYPVGLDIDLFELREQLIQEYRNSQR